MVQGVQIKKKKQKQKQKQQEQSDLIDWNVSFANQEPRREST